VLKIATYNVNSIRKRVPLVLDWLAQHKPDVLCLQETKVQNHEFPAKAFADAGYHAEFRGTKGYNGVATLSRQKPERVIYGIKYGPDEEDARILQTLVNGVHIINTYAPQGYSIRSEKYTEKLVWFARMREYCDINLSASSPVIWLGDINVAPEPIDVYHPDRRINDVDFHVDARNAYKECVGWGFVDVFRKLHPERVQYTYWDYFRNAYSRNFGWRIDHILATKILADRCVAAEVDVAPREHALPSDHTIVWAQFD
jgi:exodeoxyribonuclease III